MLGSAVLILCNLWRIILWMRIYSRVTHTLYTVLQYTSLCACSVCERFSVEIIIKTSFGSLFIWGNLIKLIRFHTNLGIPLHVDALQPCIGLCPPPLPQSSWINHSTTHFVRTCTLSSTQTLQFQDSYEFYAEADNSILSHRN